MPPTPSSTITLISHARSCALCAPLRTCSVEARALGDALERHVVARLGTDVEQRQAALAQLAQLCVGLLEDVARHRVARHARELRQLARAQRPRIARQWSIRSTSASPSATNSLSMRRAATLRGLAQVAQRLGRARARETASRGTCRSTRSCSTSSRSWPAGCSFGLGRRTVERAFVAHGRLRLSRPCASDPVLLIAGAA